MRYQLYWPAWWHLYPYFKRYKYSDYGYCWDECVFCFGPFQCMWTSNFRIQ